MIKTLYIKVNNCFMARKCYAEEYKKRPTLDG